LEPGAVANIEAEVQSAINSFSLYSYDSNQYAHLSDSKTHMVQQWHSISDWPFLEHINRSSNSLYAKGKQTVSIENYIFRDRNRLFWRKLVSLLMTGTIAVAIVVWPKTPVARFLPERFVALGFDNIPKIIPPVTDTAAAPAVDTAVTADSTAYKADSAVKK
jgi:hypothetical protein